MIKINLATRKQLAIGVVGEGNGALADLKAQFAQFKNFKFDASIFREKKVKELIAYVIASIVATVVVDGLKQDAIKEVDDQITKVTAEKAKLEKEWTQYNKFEAQKKQLDDDERLIRTKLDTVQRLLADRATPPKFLMALSSEIPKTTWLTDFKFNNGDVAMSGYAMGYSQISDFMKSLGDNVYLSDVKLLSTGKKKADVGGSTGMVDLAEFSLQAKRRPSQ